jgi:hypothetical protein
LDERRSFGRPATTRFDPHRHGTLARPSGFAERDGVAIAVTILRTDARKAPSLSCMSLRCQLMARQGLFRAKHMAFLVVVLLALILRQAQEEEIYGSPHGEPVEP